MASADPLDRTPTAPDRAIFIDRVDGVLTARRLKPAVTAQQRAKGHLIQANYSDERQSHCLMVIRLILCPERPNFQFQVH